MDKILDKKSFEVGCCGGDEKTDRPRRTDKSRTLKKTAILCTVELYHYLYICSLELIKSNFKYNTFATPKY